MKKKITTIMERYRLSRIRQQSEFIRGSFSLEARHDNVWLVCNGTAIQVFSPDSTAAEMIEALEIARESAVDYALDPRQFTRLKTNNV